MTITGYEKAAKDYTACTNHGLYAVIKLDSNTGEVWVSEYVSENDWTSYADDTVKDITADVIEMRESYWRKREKAPNLAEAIREVATAELAG